ncbi:hypothetical protein [Cohnella herbarum]|uniref:Uncharacterized protein n=1 Tax=Cohnella herbarum TaxID=2728023 RepID=A0A7Z2ZJU4_9BACL|nr:hypothetical protein [Cohnella herbarum]QJD82145.1 hypothetical protein HH215_02410 [Cohnella herbarum]
MLREENEMDLLERIRQMPRKQLSADAEQTILSNLRRLNGQKQQNVKKNRVWQNALLVASVPVLLVCLFLIPAIMEKFSYSNMVSKSPPISSSTTELSPKFDLVAKDGSVIYSDRLRGIKGKIAFSENYEIVAKSYETVSKIFWYAWGDPSLLNKAQLTATAVNLDTGEKFLANESTLGSPINGADAHAVTNFNPFPSKGKWRLDVMLNEQPYASIVIPVKDEYIHTDTARFLVSKDDAVTGTLTTLLVVQGHDLGDSVKVRAFPFNNEDEVRSFTFHSGGEFIQANDLIPITQFSGNLEFDTPGKWQIEVNGEKTIVNVREGR